MMRMAGCHLRPSDQRIPLICLIGDSDDLTRAIRDRVHLPPLILSDILSSAREKHGLERMEQIKYAVLEPHGQISIIPKTD